MWEMYLISSLVDRASAIRIWVPSDLTTFSKGAINRENRRLPEILVSTGVTV